MSLARLPLPEPGDPDLRSTRAFLWWMTRAQWRTLMLGIVWGILWMLAQAAIPVGIGAAVQGATDADNGAVLRAAVVVLVLGTVQAGAGILRHRMAVTNWITAGSRTQQLVTQGAVRMGHELRRHVGTGEVVAVTSGDVEKIGNGFDVLARFVGGIVAFVVVAAVLLHASVLLGAVVIVGIPVLGLAVGPLLRPLERAESEQRAEVGRATALATDTVAGLRVLRGIGGEELFLRRFHDASQEVRAAAVRAAKVHSLLDAEQVALPGLFVVIVTWVGAHLVVSGQLDVGQLVMFYGLSAFLLLPLRTFTETAQKWTRAYVAAGRVVAVLRLEREQRRPLRRRRRRPGGGDPGRPGLGPGRATRAAHRGGVRRAVHGRRARHAPGRARRRRRRWRRVTLAGVPLSTVPRDSCGRGSSCRTRTR